MTPEDAEEYTQALGQVTAGGWRQILLGERLGVPDALGLSTRDWVEQRLGGYVRMSVPDRKSAAVELASEGMSQRDIADVLGVSAPTVNRDLSPVSDETPAAVEETIAEVAAEEQPESVSDETEREELPGMPEGQKIADAITGAIDDATTAEIVAEAIEQHLPSDPDDPHREWRRAFLAALGQGRRAMQFDIDAVVEHADDVCLDELRRLASDVTSYSTRVVARLPKPDNVRHLKAI
jgi:transposase